MRISFDYEAHLSTVKDKSQEAARLPCAQQQQEWPRHSCQSPTCWPETPDAGLSLVPAAPQGLGRHRRIRWSRDFDRVRRTGKRVVRGCLIANWSLLPANVPSRLGVVTSRKVGNAVVRNRARRLLRESFRRHQIEFITPVDMVLVARPSIAGRTFSQVEHEFLAAARKAGLLKDPT
jgi:ribonuclease P protein component